MSAFILFHISISPTSAAYDIQESDSGFLLSEVIENPSNLHLNRSCDRLESLFLEPFPCCVIAD
jgi:hypothetical protein